MSHHAMPHDESLVFRILRLVGCGTSPSLEERTLIRSVAETSGDVYSPADIERHLGYMVEHGLLKRLDGGNGRRRLQLNWAGYDYLDDY